jgi:hypothetical protein
MPGLFSDYAIRLVAEDKIQSAIRSGEFDRLPGMGKPCALIDEPYDEYWWIRRKIAREELRSLIAQTLAANRTPATANAMTKRDQPVGREGFEPPTKGL